MNPVLKVLLLEESTDSIYDFNPTDAFADSNSLVDRNESVAGAQLWYTLEVQMLISFELLPTGNFIYKPT